MPKVSDTRKQRAQKLLDRVKTGPAWFISPIDPEMNHAPTRQAAEQAAQRSYAIWINSWVLPELIDLVPELREKKPAKPRCAICKKPFYLNVMGVAACNEHWHAAASGGVIRERFMQIIAARKQAGAS